MINPPLTIKEAQKHKYDHWNKNSYNELQCAYEVFGGWTSYQCQRKNGYGPENLYCKQHTEMVSELED